MVYDIGPNPTVSLLGVSFRMASREQIVSNKQDVTINHISIPYIYYLMHPPNHPPEATENTQTKHESILSHILYKNGLALIAGPAM